MVKVENNSELVIANSPALTLLSKREYKGLDPKYGETPIGKIEEGRSGIARAYTHETSRK